MGNHWWSRYILAYIIILYHKVRNLTVENLQSTQILGQPELLLFKACWRGIKRRTKFNFPSLYHMYCISLAHGKWNYETRRQEVMIFVIWQITSTCITAVDLRTHMACDSAEPSALISFPELTRVSHISAAVVHCFLSSCLWVYTILERVFIHKNGLVYRGSHWAR